MNEKLEYLRKKISILSIDGMIISNPINIRYLTNINAEGMLLITKKENIYITDGRYVNEVNSIITVDDKISVRDRRDISKYDYEAFFALCEMVGFEEDYVTYRQYKKMLEQFQVELVETDGIIEKLREIKDKDEIAKIEKACEITDNCFTHIQKFIKIRNDRKRDCTGNGKIYAIKWSRKNCIRNNSRFWSKFCKSSCKANR